MEESSIAPGWVARCPKCPYEVTLDKLGWRRQGAYSWGKRRWMPCPVCQVTRAMKIVHVDEQGQPDQTLGLVLRKVIGMQMAILAIVLPIVALLLWLTIKVVAN